MQTSVVKGRSGGFALYEIVSAVDKGKKCRTYEELNARHSTLTNYSAAGST